MSDSLLQSVDEALAARAGRRSSGAKPVVPAAEPIAAETPTSSYALSWRQAGWTEAFVALQFLWGVFLFVPGAQPYRGYIRALPYVASLGMLGLYFMRRQRGALSINASFLLAAIALLVLNLLHPATQLVAGLAQCVFQLSIAAPVFWAPKSETAPERVERLWLLIFVLNGLGAALGILQVYYPDRFMPPEFSSLGMQMNQYYLDGLSYVGSSGQTIIRPPGLTDQPGGAAVAGGLAAIAGIGLLLRTRRPARAMAILAILCASMAVIYLTQVRSVLLAAIFSSALLCVVAMRSRRVAGAAGGLVALGALVVGSFIWASSIGGSAVDDRFLDLRGGVMQAYQQNRGGFLSATTGDLLNEYPLGAGVGRWGMMNVYFADPTEVGSAPLYVEIQLTGWLLDGGVPMWLLYGGAVIFAILAALRMTGARYRLLNEAATTGLAIQVFIVIMAMIGPAFNTQLGILFWTVSGILHGATLSTEHVDAEPVE